jgi:hypothetical protein
MNKDFGEKYPPIACFIGYPNVASSISDFLLAKDGQRG